MKFLKISFYIALICSSTIVYSENITITDYQRTYIPVYTKDGTLSIALRTFKRNNIPSFLIVNTNNLDTRVVPITEISLTDGKNTNRLGDYAQWQIASTNYYQLLQKYTSKPYVMENYGLTHARSAVSGNILTVDMCQSSVPFEKEFFDQLASLSHKKPIPVAVSMSGLWLLMHQNEFQYLLDLQAKKQLIITWVNHSFSHPYYDDLPYTNNFLLSEMINEESEILLTEKYLLEENQVPSIFFRFPGLIANKKLIMKMKKFGLIPLGADAWIAKNQPITPGAIILVHGNGNEHQGITELTPKLKQLEFVPINSSV
ncbi:hypothetical protein OQJ13_08880 [Legionella sp. PATHC035]|uniref:hypothetical protein n=1 Tax=Legionella sp. PATHC035 TaxID=2992040 RepID=UPI00224322D8|nr:hypothetical protein [Legionella sp. PATHC035]MCW8409083.1 hypothetical protein [Legionella sp. PATHC035]